MLKIGFEKLFNFVSLESCEHCGLPSKTTLCSDCHEELLNNLKAPNPLYMVDDGSETVEVPLETH